MGCNDLASLLLIIFVVFIMWLAVGIAENFKRATLYISICIGCIGVISAVVYFFIEILPKLLCAWNICKCA